MQLQRNLENTSELVQNSFVGAKSSWLPIKDRLGFVLKPRQSLKLFCLGFFLVNLSFHLLKVVLYLSPVTLALISFSSMF